MIALLGIDCATDAQKTGLALGELRGDAVCILRCAAGTKGESPADIATDWLKDYDDALIAMDAPLGWPQDLGTFLALHRAGLPARVESDRLFRRNTDLAIKKRLNKRPLEVGANLIARTAVAALTLLDQIRTSTGRTIPLAWAPNEPERWRAIEVYPAATRIGHGAPDVGGSLGGLENLVDCSAISEQKQTKDMIDAVVCALAAADFLLGRAIPPVDYQLASIEGWIWAP